MDFLNVVPEGIEIRELSYGLGLFATCDFNKGDIVWHGKCILSKLNELPNIDYDKYCVYDVKAKLYQTYGFDRYTNHSCNPNTKSINARYVDNTCMYDTIALSDIKQGDQLTCNYFSFEYDECKIPQCMCNSNNCYSVINGFKNLSLNKKLEMLENVEQEILMEWLNDCTTQRDFTTDVKNAILDKLLKEVSPNVTIIGTSYGYGIFSAKSFKKDDVIYTTASIVSNLNELNILYNVHTVYDGDTNVYHAYGFDRFMNHSCKPNTVSYDVSTSENACVYEVVALEDIDMGTELTCDYFTLEYDVCCIDDCACGNVECMHKINGFKHLDLSNKLKRVPHTKQFVLNQWHNDK
jgi:uncharacterized protein